MIIIIINYYINSDYKKLKHILYYNIIFRKT